jgi:DNA-binding transcriptional MerR regulator
VLDTVRGEKVRSRNGRGHGGEPSVHDLPSRLHVLRPSGAQRDAGAAGCTSAGAADLARDPHCDGPGSGSGYRTGQVTRILGVTQRQLRYWAETGLVAPSARTPGGHHRYTFEDLVALRAAKQLIDAGVSVQRIRSSIGALLALLPSVRRPLSELVLVATGDVVLVIREGAAFEALSGQEWILEVSRFEREVREHLRRERRGARSEGGARRGVARAEGGGPGS